jgi:RNA polymerase sigma-70 factor (ECF subfamily)
VGDAGGRRIPEEHAAELARFHRAHAGWLFGHAYLRVQPDRELAKDMVQDTFEAAARDWETLRGLVPAQQRAWLRNTLSHKNTDQFRRGGVFLRLLPELHRRYQAAEPDPELQAISELALERAEKIIEGLPARQRKIALMKWNDHEKEADIATELGCTKGAVTAQVREIRRRLIDGLGPYYPFVGDDEEGEAS